MSDPRKASAEILRRDQKSDRSLINCWSLTDRQKAGYYIRDGVFYRNYKYLGQNYELLVLPVNRRQEVIRLAHKIDAGHLGAKKTKERIKLSFTWPTIASDVQKACKSCHQCQKKRRVAVCDKVSVMLIKKDKVTGSKVPVDFQGRENSELVSIRKCHKQVNEVICDTVTTGHEQTKINHCAVIYDDDSDFGSVDVIDADQFQQPELLPCQRIDLNTLSHLSVEQKSKLLALLDNYSENFSENPRFVTVNQHEFDNSADCKPSSLKINYMLEDLKPLIEARLQELFRLSFVHPQRNRRGTPMKGVFGGQYRVGAKCVWLALQKFRNWIFGQPTTVIYSDHNPLTYITESSTKSAKLMRWLLSLPSYNVTFKYKEGRKNVVVDCLSRLDSATE